MNIFKTCVVNVADSKSIITLLRTIYAKIVETMPKAIDENRAFDSGCMRVVVVFFKWNSGKTINHTVSTLGY